VVKFQELSQTDLPSKEIISTRISMWIVESIWYQQPGPDVFF
jgi:hypothetical protein